MQEGGESVGRKKTNFEDSLILNNQAYIFYLNRLTELALTCYEWRNLPDSVDERYIEIGLFNDGNMVYFNDEVVGNLCLNCAVDGGFNVYGEPLRRRAYSKYNSYQRTLDGSDSVIVWNNYMRLPSYDAVCMFARKLYEIDRSIDVNVKAQRTPTLITCDEKQRLSALNLYKEYDGNAPVILGNKDLNLIEFKVLKTDAPFVAKDLYELKVKVWNEALTYLGISNVSVEKKERLISDEVQRQQGGTMSSRYSRLGMRQQAAEKINRMFGTDIEVAYRENVNTDFPQNIADSDGSGDSRLGGGGSE